MLASDTGHASEATEKVLDRLSKSKKNATFLANLAKET
jgi:hypothetical protein